MAQHRSLGRRAARTAICTVVAGSGMAMIWMPLTAVRNVWPGMTLSNWPSLRSRAS